MKAFIAVLLVASAAAQMDVMDWKLRDNLKFKNIRSVEDLLMKEKMGGVYGYDTKNMMGMDWLNTFVGDRMTTDNIMTLEEMIAHPVFRQYLSIPLFRQFWEEYPVVFRRYVESPLFQKFWMMPEFMTYFRNPVLFYKYIVPQIQVIQTIVPTTEGVYNNYNLPYAYRQQNREWTTPSTYGRMFNTHPFTTTTNYKYLLEKMMNHLNLKKDRIETLTDIKMLPSGEVTEQTIGKFVDPITGIESMKVGDIKMVDEKIVPVQNTLNLPLGIETLTNKFQMGKIFGNNNVETMKNVLLKHLILNNMFNQEKKMQMIPEVHDIYRTLLGEHKEVIPELYKLLESVHGEKKFFLPEVFNTVFDTEKVMGHPKYFNTIFNTHKNVLPQEIYEQIYENLFNKKMISLDTLEKIFGKQVYETLGEKVFPEVYNKYDIDFEPSTYHHRLASPMITRMLKNKMMVNKFAPKMDIMTTLKTEKMIEELKKEELIKELIKNKEHSIFTPEMEFPTMFETQKMKHIPLTLNKPVIGGLEIFPREHEVEDIKF